MARRIILLAACIGLSGCINIPDAPVDQTIRHTPVLVDELLIAPVVEVDFNALCIEANLDEDDWARKKLAAHGVDYLSLDCQDVAMEALFDTPTR